MPCQEASNSESGELPPQMQLLPVPSRHEARPHLGKTLTLVSRATSPTHCPPAPSGWAEVPGTKVPSYKWDFFPSPQSLNCKRHQVFPVWERETKDFFQGWVTWVPP